MPSDIGTKTDLSVREKVVIDKIGYSEFPRATIRVGNTNRFRLDSGTTRNGRRVGELDSHDDWGRDDVGVDKQQVLHRRQVTRRSLTGVWVLWKLGRIRRTYLLIQNELGSFLALSCLGNPYFDFELLTSQGIPQKALGKTFTESNARQTTAASEVLDDRVGAEDVGCNIEGIGSVHGVVLAAEEESDSSRFRGLWGEFCKEGAETGMR